MDDNVKVKLEAAYESNNSIKPVKRLDEWLKECKSRNLINDEKNFRRLSRLKFLVFLRNLETCLTIKNSQLM